VIICEQLRNDSKAYDRCPAHRATARRCQSRVDRDTGSADARLPRSKGQQASFPLQVARMGTLGHPVPVHRRRSPRELGHHNNLLVSCSQDRALLRLFACGQDVLERHPGPRSSLQLLHVTRHLALVLGWH
jgi:hypothetical protein